MDLRRLFETERMNIWSYNSLDFGSARVPFCEDGTTAAGVLPGQIPWDRTQGFTDLADLVTGLGALFPDTTAAPRTPMTLGILTHGRPDGIVMLPSRGILTTTGFGTYGPVLTELNGILRRGGRPTVILYACAAGARHRDNTSGMTLLEWMSGWMENTRVVGFTRLLTLDGLRTQDLRGGGFCLAPDVFETTEEYEYSRDIRDQMGSGTAEGALSLAGTESTSAVEYLNGRRVSARTRTARPAGRPRSGGRPARP